jgi:molybdopterin/thiamine biosynthesis adenylyltransferase
MGQKVEIHLTKPDLDGVKFRSIYKDQMIELAEVRNPSAKEAQLERLAMEISEQVEPVYVHYPWRQELIECLPGNEFFELRTNRNQHLITAEEQAKLYSQKIAIAGMSVGSSILFGLVGSGFGCEFSIADDDVMSNTNLNRVPATMLDIGTSKVEVAYRRAMEMNPFIKVNVMDQRITAQNVDEFLMRGDASVIFEEIDDFKMKLTLREEAQKRKMPLVMLTGLGDSVMIDVERYDTDPSTQPFLGLVSDELLDEIRTKEIDTDMMKKLSVALVDASLLSDRAIESVKDIGTKLVGRPQLYGAVAMDSAVGPYVLRGLVGGDSLSTTLRTVLSCERIKN